MPSYPSAGRGGSDFARARIAISTSGPGSALHRSPGPVQSPRLTSCSLSFIRTPLRVCALTFCVLRPLHFGRHASRSLDFASSCARVRTSVGGLEPSDRRRAPCAYAATRRRARAAGAGGGALPGSAAAWRADDAAARYQSSCRSVQPSDVLFVLGRACDGPSAHSDRHSHRARPRSPRQATRRWARSTRSRASSAASAT